MKNIVKNALCFTAGISSAAALLLIANKLGTKNKAKQPCCGNDNELEKITAERDNCILLLDEKRSDEFQLQCTVTQAIDELLKTREADSIDYIKEKIEDVITLLNNSVE